VLSRLQSKSAVEAAVRDIPSIAELMGDEIVSAPSDILGNDFANQVALVIARVRAALPEPMDAEQAAIFNVELSPSKVSSLLMNGRSVDHAVRELIDKLRHELEKTEAKDTVKTQALVVKGAIAELRIERVERSLSYADLSFDERARLELDLEQLAETGEYNPQAMRMERGLLRYDFAPGRYVYIDPSSIRHTRVEKATIHGEEFYRISRRAFPVLSEGRIRFSRRLDDGLVSVRSMEDRGIFSAEQLRDMLREQDLEQTMRLFQEFSDYLKHRVEELARAAKEGVQALKVRMQQGSGYGIGGGVPVSLAQLGTFSSGMAVPMSSLMAGLAAEVTHLSLA